MKLCKYTHSWQTTTMNELFKCKNCDALARLNGETWTIVTDAPTSRRKRSKAVNYVQEKAW